ncbi:MAG: XRE family transcriptional regulator [Gammaproteobacteria bacterium]|nr:MAG: XRE family transcriptional regulator [Gammaproteobacteria bacterium]
MNRTGSAIRKIREQKGLTQDQLAVKCQLLEWNISRGTLAKIESRVRRMTDFEVELAAKALGVEISELYKS